MNLHSDTNPLARCIARIADIVGQEADEADILEAGGKALRDLIARDDWLPEFCSVPDPHMYRQYLLYCDPLERFSIVSFVWGPGQRTPIHDHATWGLVGVLRGAEISERYVVGSPMKSIQSERFEVGAVDVVSPSLGDIHLVRNALSDRASISIHIYGGNIGVIERRVFDPDTGHSKKFVSGYSNDRLPNPWRTATKFT
jgi:predicted metal-dependent enzyme (double-stranded beta helix superfamily)